MRILKKFLLKILNIFFSNKTIISFLPIKSIHGSHKLFKNYSKDYFKEMRKIESWKLVPLGVRVFKPAKNETIQTNEQGFRTKNFDFKNKKIIIIIGGSASWGMGATSNNKMFASLLEEKLKKNSEKWSVINLSMMAATSQQELLYLIFWGLKLNPEIVISFTGFNDLTLPNNFFDKKNNVFILPDILKYKQNHDRIYSKDNSLLKRMFLSLKDGSLKKGDNQNNKKEIDIKERSEVFLKSNELILNLSKVYGFKYYSILQPNAYNKKLSFEEDEQQKFYLNDHDSSLEYSQCYKFTKQNGLYHHIINKKNLKNFLNYENLFDEDTKMIFTDGIVHFNDYGHEIISNKIYDQLIKDGFC